MSARIVFEVRKSRILKRNGFDSREEAMASMAGRRGWLVLSSETIVEVLEFSGSPKYRSLDGSRGWNYGQMFGSKEAAKRAQLRDAKTEHRTAVRLAQKAAALVKKLAKAAP